MHTHKHTCMHTYTTNVCTHTQDMFAAFKVIAATELTLGGNAELSSVERLQWNIQGGSGGKGGKQPTYSPVRGPDFVVTLEPMDIRTFEIQVVPTTN